MVTPERKLIAIHGNQLQQQHSSNTEVIQVKKNPGSIPIQVDDNNFHIYTRRKVLRYFAKICKREHAQWRHEPLGLLLTLGLDL